MRRLGAVIFCLVLWAVCLAIVIIGAVDFFKVLEPLREILKALEGAETELLRQARWAVWKQILIYLLQLLFYLLVTIGLSAAVLKTSKLSKQRKQFGESDEFSVRPMAGKKSAENLFSYDDGSAYIGSIVNGLHHGQGRYYFPDGTCYSGAFENGEFHGYGTLFNVQNQILQQDMWFENRFMG